MGLMSPCDGLVAEAYRLLGERRFGVSCSSMALTPEHPDQMVYAGIDEAGYGPRIGPLTVAMSAFRVPASTSSASPDGLHGAAPDLWRLLRAAVGKAKQAAGKRAPVIYVDDSKLLKGSNGLKRRHPLDRLEQGVLSFLRTLDQTPTSDLELFNILGANIELAPWYLGEPILTPVSTTSAHIGVLANALRAAMVSSEVETVALRCELIGEAAFNKMVAEHGSKAVVNFSAVAKHLRFLWKRFGHDNTLVAIDRQGGRVSYGRQLAGAIPGVIVRVVNESQECSAYELVEKNAVARENRSRRMVVRFDVKGDTKHFPTALASMTAKLVRELSMHRLNRFWSGRLIDLKPTAGYGVDVNRWLGEVESLLSADDRSRLVRQA
jgi:ribonuclease HII